MSGSWPYISSHICSEIRILAQIYKLYSQNIHRLDTSNKIILIHDGPGYNWKIDILTPIHTNHRCLQSTHQWLHRSRWIIAIAGRIRISKITTGGIVHWTAPKLAYTSSLIELIIRRIRGLVIRGIYGLTIIWTSVTWMSSMSCRCILLTGIKRLWLRISRLIWGRISSLRLAYLLRRLNGVLILGVLLQIISRLRKIAIRKLQLLTTFGFFITLQIMQVPLYRVFLPIESVGTAHPLPAAVIDIRQHPRPSYEVLH